MTNLVGKALNQTIDRARWFGAVLKNEPHNFYFLDKDVDGNFTYEGKVVKTEVAGDEREISYITLDDILEFSVRFEMTYLKLVKGLNVNAVYVNHDKWRRLSEYVGAVPVQPVFAEIPNSQQDI